MELKDTPENLLNDLIKDFIHHGVDINAPIQDIQSALNNVGVIASAEELVELVDILKDHRRTCPECIPHYHEDGTERDDIDHTVRVH